MMNVPALGLGFLNTRADILIVGIGPMLRAKRRRQELYQPPFFLRQLMTLAVRAVIERIPVFRTRRKQACNYGQHGKGYDSTTHPESISTCQPLPVNGHCLHPFIWGCCMSAPSAKQPWIDRFEETVKP